MLFDNTPRGMAPSLCPHTNRAQDGEHVQGFRAAQTDLGASLDSATNWLCASGEVTSPFWASVSL